MSTYTPRPRVYKVRLHDGKTAHTVECTAPTRKEVYTMYEDYKVLSVQFVRWASDT